MKEDLDDLSFKDDEFDSFETFKKEGNKPPEFDFKTVKENHSDEFFEFSIPKEEEEEDEDEEEEFVQNPKFKESIKSPSFLNEKERNLNEEDFSDFQKEFFSDEEEEIAPEFLKEENESEVSSLRASLEEKIASKPLFSEGKNKTEMGMEDEIEIPEGLRITESKSTETKTVRKVIFILFALFVLIAVFYRLNRKVDETKYPVFIKADEIPFKERPVDKGGLYIPNQDKKVYQLLDKKKEELQIEHTAPTTEDPKEPIALEEVKNSEDVEKLIKEETYGRKEEAPQIVVSDEMPLEVLPLKPVQKKVQKKAPTPPKVKEIPTKKGLLLDSKKATEKEALKKNNSQVKKQALKKTGKAFAVQLLSAQNEKAVEKAWENILKKQKQILSKYSHRVKKVKIGKNTFYRLLIGNFRARTEALSLCKKLKAHKQSCVLSVLE
ncbi:MAG: SPOR domain-containing protein [Alphaproteobacteria bacterium]|nr:SPOR domain-containing protein [Alphaproteobacteria bacterium]